MAHTKHKQVLEGLARLDFTDKGESFVEQKFVTPLLECLGYETHKDYEVIRHGEADDTRVGASGVSPRKVAAFSRCSIGR
jgi:hypothetical protein